MTTRRDCLRHVRNVSLGFPRCGPTKAREYYTLGRGYLFIAGSQFIWWQKIKKSKWPSLLVAILPTTLQSMMYTVMVGLGTAMKKAHQDDSNNTTQPTFS